MHVFLAQSNYSFLQGASFPHELVETAHRLGYGGLGLADFDGIYGLVQAHRARPGPPFRMFYGAQALIDLCRLPELRGARGVPFEGAREDPVFLQNRVAFYAPTKKAYGQLCAFLSYAHRHGKHAVPIAPDDAGAPWPVDCLALLPARGAAQLFSPGNAVFFERWLNGVHALAQRHGRERLHLALTLPTSAFERNAQLNHEEAHRRLGLPLLATEDVFFHAPERKPLHDTLTAIRLNGSHADTAWACFPNDERTLHPRAVVERYFGRTETRRRALENNLRVAGQMGFCMGELTYSYPSEFIPAGFTAAGYLHHLVREGLTRRFGQCVPERIRLFVDKELTLVDELGFADYFLTVWDIVRFAREQGILCQGRGSAANSAICYLLGVTAVDPMVSDVLFERFISRERGEPPDIDVDFEHERREEVIQYIYRRYGRAHAAMVANVITFRTRGALRAVGKAFGLSEAECTRVLAIIADRQALKTPFSELLADGVRAAREDARAEERTRAQSIGRHGNGNGAEAHVDAGPLRAHGAVQDREEGDIVLPSEAELSSSSSDGLARRVTGTAGTADTTNVRTAGQPASFDATLEALMPLIPVWAARARELKGFPRHLGIHSGGFIISHEPLDALCAQEPATMAGRSVVQWNKDDVEALGLFKIDLLSLGMLTALRKTLQALEAHRKCVPGTLVPVRLDTLPPDCAKTYDLICEARTTGVFQIESRAQMAMLPKVRPRSFYEIVIQIGIIRPGPIVSGIGAMYTRRKQGREAITYPHPRLRPILERTLGVPVFQEQIMRIAMEVGDFSPGEADALRRSMGAFKFTGDIRKFEAKLREGMRANGISDAFAEQIYRHIEGFAQYGFPESHSTSFAHLAYSSCYLKAHYPQYFLCGLLNSQPLGFYSVHSLLQEAGHAGVRILQPCVLRSAWDSQVLPSGEVRLGLRLMRGLCKERIDAFVRLRESITTSGRAPTLQEIYASLDVLTAPEKVVLAMGDAFASQTPHRRDVLWELLARPSALLPDVESLHFKPKSGLHEAWDNMQDDLSFLSTTLGPHPMALVKRIAWPYAVAPERILTARELIAARDKATVTVCGLVMVRQAPPTAKGMTFITLEDETGTMNLVIRPDVYARCRPHLLGKSMICVRGKKQENGPQSIVLVTDAVPAREGAQA